MADSSTWTDPRTQVVGAGIVLVLAVFYLVYIVVGFQFFEWDPIESQFRIGMATAVATIALATGVFAQGYLNARRIEDDEKHRIATADSQWTPEFIHYFGNEIVIPETESEGRQIYQYFDDDVTHAYPDKFAGFRGSRGWYPKFKLMAEGESSVIASGMSHIPTNITNGVYEYELKRPTEVSDFFFDLKDGDKDELRQGEIWITFKSNLGYDHLYKFEIDFWKESFSYKIENTRLIEKVLPWEGELDLEAFKGVGDGSS